MGDPVRNLAIALMICLAGVPACGWHCRTATHAPSSVTGNTVTRDVPSSKETIGEIREKESIHPSPPLEDRAIPSHRIPRSGETGPPPAPESDNTVK